ncbi:MAG TPA: hypothetical protein VFK84_04480 [Burkholderiales bacterium]|nr:hypothetical protein [Burkholderiales bacterium]
MRRPSLEPDDLLALLNWELAAYEECAGTRFTSIRPFPARDDIGCNWVDAGFATDHRMALDEQFIVHHIVEQTRRRFDLTIH